MKRIAIANVTRINAEVLHPALAALSAKFKGLVFDVDGLALILDEDTDQVVISTLTTACLAHNPDTLSPQQAVIQQGKVDAQNLLALIDQALTDIATKRAAFNATPNFTTAGTLLNELAQDVVGLLKYARYDITRNP